jgi:release factor glutamine methyltransferase
MPEHVSDIDSYRTWRQLLSETTENCGNRVTARWLCEHASGADGAEFDEILDDHATQRSVAHLDAMLARLATGEPLQYVMGRWAFRYLDVLVDSRVLIPRPETEVLAGIVIEQCRSMYESAPQVLVADMGTGSGVIGLSVLAEMPFESCTVWMTDASEDALHVARANAVGIGRAATRARFAQGNWCAALPSEHRQQFDVIVANPPYIAVDDAEVDSSVRQWEPHNALFAGADGLDDIIQIVDQSRDWLRPGGMLAVEMGYRQGAVVQKLFLDHGFVNVAIHRDLTDRERFTTGFLPAH